jgi:hypothetical protein
VWEKIFTGNTTETVSFIDVVGNSGSTGIVITRIDRTLPHCSVSYDVSTPTSGTVIASLTGCSESIVSVETDFTFTGNGSHTFFFTDLAGNAASAVANVTRIDTSVPQALAVMYSPSTLTNGNVLATLYANEPVHL